MDGKPKQQVSSLEAKLEPDLLELDTRSGKLALNGKELAKVKSVDIHCTPEECTANISLDTDVNAHIEIVGRAKY